MVTGSTPQVDDDDVAKQLGLPHGGREEYLESQIASWRDEVNHIARALQVPGADKDDLAERCFRLLDAIDYKVVVP